MINEKIEKYISDHNMIKPGDTVIIGISGGADSVCLFRILLELKTIIDFDIVAIHVHHGIRGIDADEDESFVTSLCENHNIKIINRKYDIPSIAKDSGESEEECGRRIRYEVFNQIASEYTSPKIAVAHHMNDQAETVLFRMFRGTGIKGIAGMKPVNGIIIRPLLCVNRDAILSYLDTLKQEYRNDVTNDDIKYSRNYIRKEIIPRIDKINPNIINHISELSNEADEVFSYMDNLADKLLDEAIYEVDEEIINKYMQDANNIQVYGIKPFLHSEEIIRKYALRKIIQRAGLSLKDVTREHINKLNEILETKEARSINLPRSIKIIKEADYVILQKCDGTKREQIDVLVINGEGEYGLPNNAYIRVSIFDKTNDESIPSGIYTKWLDYDKISNNLCIRNRLSGDYLVVNKDGGRKKLKEYMIEEKIPQSLRDDIYVLANESRIAWVVGKRISEDVKVTETTKKIIQIEYIKER